MLYFILVILFKFICIYRYPTVLACSLAHCCRTRNYLSKPGFMSSPDSPLLCKRKGGANVVESDDEELPDWAANFKVGGTHTHKQEASRS